jgi:hypothetical protein
MKRSTFIRILKAIKQVSNNVSAVENFNRKALVAFTMPSIIAETPIQQKALRKLVEHASYFKIVPGNDDIVITVEFELD